MSKNLENLLAFLESDGVMEKVQNAATVSDFKAIVEEKGITLTDEEWVELWNGIQPEAEINEEDLVNAAGGMVFNKLRPLIPTLPLPPRFPALILSWLKR